jgi:hypothetical protein
VPLSYVADEAAPSLFGSRSESRALLVGLDRIATALASPASESENERVSCLLKPALAAFRVV